MKSSPSAPASPSQRCSPWLHVRATTHVLAPLSDCAASWNVHLENCSSCARTATRTARNAMKFDRESAKAMLRAQAAAINDSSVDENWCAKVERLSQLCQGLSKTHIAFLGTALLAKALAPKA